jgi:hypothetical protein
MRSEPIVTSCNNRKSVWSGVSYVGGADVSLRLGVKKSPSHQEAYNCQTDGMTDGTDRWSVG